MENRERQYNTPFEVNSSVNITFPELGRGRGDVMLTKKLTSNGLIDKFEKYGNTYYSQSTCQRSSKYELSCVIFLTLVFAIMWFQTVMSQIIGDGSQGQSVHASNDYHVCKNWNDQSTTDMQTKLYAVPYKN
ncbi:hypothetical protein C2G38_2161559 [Gigaspora rosea]|uniref:Uncharacterized protein n=1 Tax=Gigaspora rosea TaxID=44941 RepID=A0A397VYK5_9GLOM|nr:hypothetical protein C2G38_2161559 [Gigaspora rosea]